MKQRIGLVTLFVLFLIALQACAPTAAEATNEINVVTTDFHFTPDKFTVQAGDEVTLNMKNDGKVKHEFVIIKLGMEPTIPWGEDDQEKVFWEHEAEPGTTITEKFTAPTEPGEYIVLCGIQGHLEADMKGKLVVVAE